MMIADVCRDLSEALEIEDCIKEIRAEINRLDAIAEGGAAEIKFRILSDDVDKNGQNARFLFVKLHVEFFHRKRVVNF